ncbi:MAG: hypothetical protein KIT10_13880 [Flavobacteriales bacterium]|nr:hypothetical protein [Flavobacteriales bacterium]
MGAIAEIFSILVTSMVKFAFSPLLAYQLGYGFLDTLMITALGGCCGVLLFYGASGWLMERARRKRVARELAGAARKRSFTRTNRMIVRVKRRGLGGLAAITPAILSIPIGSIIAAKYYRDDRRTLPMLLVSVLAWAILLSGFWTFAR